MKKKLITMTSLVFAIAPSLPVAVAKADPPQNGGGCNMVWHLSDAGATNMMAGSANGAGQTHMIEQVLVKFSDNLCGVFGP
jgi:hypothetical protein